MLKYKMRAYFSRRKGMLALCWVLALAAAVILAISMINGLLDGLLENYMQVKTQAIVTDAINSAVIDELSQNPGIYEALVTVGRLENGEISSINTDTVKINILKSNVTLRMLENLAAMESRNFTVPLGTLLGGNLFLGRGPGISLRIMPVGALSSTLKSQFLSAGINQTLHRVVIEVEVGITVVMPGAAVYITKSDQVVLGETVIVGAVPESYTYIDDTRDSTIEKIFDHG